MAFTTSLSPPRGGAARRILVRDLALVVTCALLASLVSLLTATQAQAAPRTDLRSVTWNAQGGNKWQAVRDYMMKEADILALQEVNTPPVQFVTHDELTRLSNTSDTSTTPGGLPSLKYRVFTQKYGSGSRGEPSGQVFWVDILDKGLWGTGGSGPDEDPDTQNNTQKSMAVWVNSSVGANFDALQDIKIVTPRGDNGKWLRSRPAVGVRVNGTWYFNIHAASIRSGATPNPHAKALTQAVADAVGNEPWRIMGDFNSDAQSFRAQVRGNTYYGTRNGKPNGVPVPTQQSGYAIDFMTSSEALTDLAVSISSNGGSDHRPIRFAPTGMRECRADWDSRTLYSPGALAALDARTAQSAAAAGESCTGGDAVVSMGDSYISGEGGRWQGNGAPELSYRSRQGSAFGTDRAAFDCTGTGKDEVCEHDPKRVYGETAAGGDMCHRSDLAPIKSIGDVLGIPAERRFNIACSGATTTDVTDNVFKGEEPQVKQLAKIAAENNVKYVVLSIGGNDLGFSDIGFNCVVGYVGNKACSTNGRSDVYTKTRGIQEKVTKAIVKIKETLSDAGQENPKIILQAYPNPVSSVENNRYPSKALSWARMMTGGCALLDPDLDWLHYEVVPQLNEALADAAHEQNIIFLNTQNAFAGHELCAKASSQASELNAPGNPPQAKTAEWVRWIPGLATWLPYAQGDKQEAIHPNAFGQQALGTCVAKAMDATSWRSRGYFTCSGQAGATPDQVEVADKDGDTLWPGGATGPVSMDMRLRNAATGDLIDADWGGAGAWGKATAADGSARQRWHVDNFQKLDGELLPGVPVRAVATIKSGDNFLHIDDSRRWAKLVPGGGGKPVSWAVGHTLYDGSSQLYAYESNGQGAYDIIGCLSQNPGLIGKDDHQSWLSVEHCTYDMNQQWWFEAPGTVAAQTHADGWSTSATGQIVSSAAQTCVSGAQAEQVRLAACADGKDQQWQARASVTAPASRAGAAPAAAAADPATDPHGAFFFVNQSSGQCLDYDRTNLEVLQWECNGGNNQQWYHYGDTLRSVFNDQCLKPGEDGALVTTECATAPEEWEGGIAPKDNDRVTLQSATGLAMDLTAGDTSAGTKILGWTPCRCKNNQIWDLRADPGTEGVWRLAPMALGTRHVSYDAQDGTVTLMDAVADNKGEQWRLEPAGGGWYRIVSALDGTMVTAMAEGEPLALKEPSNYLGQLWRINLNNR